MFCDLLWSDPDEDTEWWAESPRGAGFLFGAAALRIAMRANATRRVLRGHTLEADGARTFFGGALLSLFSAPNLAARCGNRAALARVGANGDIAVETFAQSEEHEAVAIPYWF